MIENPFSGYSVENKKDKEWLVVRRQAQLELFADLELTPFSSIQELWLTHAEKMAHATSLDDFSQEVKEEMLSKRRMFTRFVDNLSAEDTFLREDAIRLYNNGFRKPVQSLLKKIEKAHYPHLIDEYLGEGENSLGFLLVSNNKQFALKKSKYGACQTNFDMKPLNFAKGIAHTTQPITHSMAEHVHVLSLLPGTNVASFTPENQPNYTDEDYFQAFGTLINLYYRGLIIDPKRSNFVYSSDASLGFLDFHLQPPSTRIQEEGSLERQFVYLMSPFRRQLSTSNKEEEWKIRKGENAHYLQLLRRYNRELYDRVRRTVSL